MKNGKIVVSGRCMSRAKHRNRLELTPEEAATFSQVALCNVAGCHATVFYTVEQVSAELG